MEKQEALRLIAEKGYDVGYSAKLHFATYDIVEKAPGWIGFPLRSDPAKSQFLN